MPSLRQSCFFSPLNLTWHRFATFLEYLSAINEDTLEIYLYGHGSPWGDLSAGPAPFGNQSSIISKVRSLGFKIRSAEINQCFSVFHEWLRRYRYNNGERIPYGPWIHYDWKSEWESVAMPRGFSGYEGVNALGFDVGTPSWYWNFIRPDSIGLPDGQ